jgi:hypothetical protein
MEHHLLLRIPDAAGSSLRQVEQSSYYILKQSRPIDGRRIPFSRLQHAGSLRRSQQFFPAVFVEDMCSVVVPVINLICISTYPISQFLGSGLMFIDQIYRDHDDFLRIPYRETASHLSLSRYDAVFRFTSHTVGQAEDLKSTRHGNQSLDKGRPGSWPKIHSRCSCQIHVQV